MAIPDFFQELLRIFSPEMLKFQYDILSMRSYGEFLYAQNDIQLQIQLSSSYLA
jgi:hypothetical protein